MSEFDSNDFNNLLKTSVNTGIITPTQGIIPQLEANRALTGVGSQEVKAQSLTADTSDNIILGDASQTKMTNGTITDSNTSVPDSAVDLITGQAMSEVYGDLSKFAAESDFVANMNLAFGEKWDAVGAKALAEGWFNRDFSAIPPVKVVSSAEINGANGAFAGATNTIYLSKEFLAQNGANPGAVADVLLEEIGHSVDARLNVTDTPGDEGAIFAALVQGKVLSQSELQALRGEDDHGTATIGGQTISIEKAAFDINNRWYVQAWNGNNSGWESLWNGGGQDFGSNTRSDGKKGFSQDWGKGSPGNGINNDFFALAFWTQADFQQGQTYNFNIRADDGYALAAVPVGAQDSNQWEYITQWKFNEDAYGGKTVQFTPKNSGKYWVLEFYRERDGNAYFDTSWEKISNSSQVELSNNNSQVYTAQAFVNSWRNLPEYTNRNPFPDKGQNCTWYAHGRMLQLGYSKAALDTMWGNAGTWDNTAKNGATVSNTPQAPSIAVWEPWVGSAGEVGHVAVVERVNSDGSILISESNWDKTQYNTRTISRNGGYWPSEFITVPKA